MTICVIESRHETSGFPEKIRRQSACRGLVCSVKSLVLSWLSLRVEQTTAVAIGNLTDVDLRDAFSGIQRSRKASIRVTTSSQLHFWPTHLPLSLVSWAKARYCCWRYYLGQSVMRLAGNRIRLGDYTGVVAVKARSA
jgi:hypothetical protein